MPALITHHLFGEESIDRLPAGIVTSDEERCAFLLGNQGPDPFFFRVRTPYMRDCMQLARVMHRSRMTLGLGALLPWDFFPTMCSIATLIRLCTSSSLACSMPIPIWRRQPARCMQ